MTIYTKGITFITSTDEGAEAFTLMSTEEEPKKLLRVVYWDVVTNPLYLSIWLERQQIAKDIPLEVIADATPERVIEVDVVIPLGWMVKGIIKAKTAGSQGTLVGMIEYEITK